MKFKVLKLLRKLNVKYNKQIGYSIPNTISRKHIHMRNCELDDDSARVVAWIIRNGFNQQQPLLEVRLVACLMSQAAWDDILKSLSRQKTVTFLDLSQNVLGGAAHQLVQSIKFWGYNPPLQRLSLYNCSLPIAISAGIAKFLSSCKHLIELNLGGNNLMKAGHQLVKSIQSWGDEPLLEELRLYNCSLQVAASHGLLQSLSKFKHLTALNLGGNSLSEASHQLAQSIRYWEDKPPLQELCLSNCSLTATASLELAQSLSACKHLTVLNLGGNNIGEGGKQLAQSISSWGDEPQLQELWLYNCSLTDDASDELVKSLSTCKQLTVLNFGENNLRKCGYQLAQSISCWGDAPPLKELWLYDCSLAVSASFEIAQSLVKCKLLTKLDLGGNNLSEAGYQLARSIRSWGNEPPLKELWLYDCSLSVPVSLELVQSLSTCRHLTVLHFEENKLAEAGHQLAESIRLWGDEPPLQELSLSNCSLPVAASLDVVKSLLTCRHLTALELGGNNLGEAGHQFAETIKSWGDEPALQELELFNCSLTVAASIEIVQSLSTCKNLIAVNLGENSIGETGYHLAQSIRSWGENPSLQELYLDKCSLPANASTQLLQSLLTCGCLTHLSLWENDINETGHELATKIRLLDKKPAVVFKLHQPHQLSELTTGE